MYLDYLLRDIVSYFYFIVPEKAAVVVANKRVRGPAELLSCLNKAMMVKNAESPGISSKLANRKVHGRI